MWVYVFNYSSRKKLLNFMKFLNEIHGSYGHSKLTKSELLTKTFFLSSSPGKVTNLRLAKRLSRSRLGNIVLLLSYRFHICPSFTALVLTNIINYYPSGEKSYAYLNGTKCQIACMFSCITVHCKYLNLSYLITFPSL